MTDSSFQQPSTAVIEDAHNEKAPDPRRHYKSPEDLREDISLGLARREELLRQWKLDVDRELEAESEGMSAADPISAERESSLAGEERRVTKALQSVIKDRELADQPTVPSTWR